MSPPQTVRARTRPQSQEAACEQTLADTKSRKFYACAGERKRRQSAYGLRLRRFASHGFVGGHTRFQAKALQIRQSGRGQRTAVRNPDRLQTRMPAFLHGEARKPGPCGGARRKPASQVRRGRNPAAGSAGYLIRERSWDSTAGTSTFVQAPRLSIIPGGIAATAIPRTI
jgi:hypothetical protein